MALALDQSAHKNITSGSSTTITLSTTAANCIIYLAIAVNGTSVSAITSAHLTWARRKTTGGTNPQEAWYAVASGTLASEVITVTLVGATTAATIDVFGISGADTSTIFDSNFTVPNSQPTIQTAVAINTQNANTFILGGYRMATQATPTQGTGFTKISGANFLLTEFKIVSAVQSGLSVAIGTGAGNQNGGFADALVQAAGGTLAIDQSAHKNVTSGSSTTITLSTTAANCIIYLVASLNGASLTSVTSAHLTWAKRKTTGGNPLEQWYAVASGTLSSEVITVSLSGATSFMTLDVFGIAGVDPVNTFDSVPFGTPLSLSTTNADTFILGAYRMATQASPTEGSGFTKISGANFQLIEYQIVSSPQTNLTLSIGTGVNDQNGSIADAIIQGIGPPPPHKSVGVNFHREFQYEAGWKAAARRFSTPESVLVPVALPAKRRTRFPEPDFQPILRRRIADVSQVQPATPGGYRPHPQALGLREPPWHPKHPRRYTETSTIQPAPPGGFRPHPQAQGLRAPPWHPHAQRRSFDVSTAQPPSGPAPVPRRPVAAPPWQPPKRRPAIDPAGAQPFIGPYPPPRRRFADPAWHPPLRRVASRIEAPAAIVPFRQRRLPLWFFAEPWQPPQQIRHALVEIVPPPPPPPPYSPMAYVADFDVPYGLDGGGGSQNPLGDDRRMARGPKLKPFKGYPKAKGFAKYPKR